MKDGSNTTEGVTYQDIPDSGLPFHRGDSSYRAKRITELVDVKDKTLLDLGCSVGTISATLASFGAKVTGVDYDEEAIATANKYYGPVASFQVQDITLEYIQGLPHYDVVIWLSQFMWLAKQKGIDYALDCLWELSKKCDTLVFETAGMDGSAPLGIGQEVVIQILLKNTVFQDIVDTGPWTGGVHMSMNWPSRNVFVCSKPFLGSETELSKIELLKRGEVKKTYNVNEGSVGREILQREIDFLNELNGIVPTILSTDENSITMTYEGPRTKFIPERDAQIILDWLRIKFLIHRDIRPENILWNGKNIVLIDLAWMIRVGEDTNYSHDIGGKYKSPYGFNDEYSLRKVQKELL